MHNEFKNKTKVIIYGRGKNNGKFYYNVPAIIIERDPYYKDYHIAFKDGTTDWILPKYIRQPYSRKKKRSK